MPQKIPAIGEDVSALMPPIGADRLPPGASGGTLAQRVRAKFPGAYDDLSDHELEAKVRAKFPGVYDDLPSTCRITVDDVIMRCACYARYSSDLQRATSIEDQLRAAQRYAREQGWTIDETQIFTDAGISGASIDGRPGLQALLTAAAGHPLPLEALLVDDSSRVARDLADAIRVLQTLKFFGVRVVYISQHIDSADEQAETLVAVHGRFAVPA